MFSSFEHFFALQLKNLLDLTFHKYYEGGSNCVIKCHMGERGVNVYFEWLLKVKHEKMNFE